MKVKYGALVDDECIVYIIAKKIVNQSVHI